MKKGGDEEEKPVYGDAVRSDKNPRRSFVYGRKKVFPAIAACTISHLDRKEKEFMGQISMLRKTCFFIVIIRFFVLFNIGQFTLYLFDIISLWHIITFSCLS